MPSFTHHNSAVNYATASAVDRQRDGIQHAYGQSEEAGASSMLSGAEGDSPSPGRLAKRRREEVEPDPRDHDTAV